MPIAPKTWSLLLALLLLAAPPLRAAAGSDVLQGRLAGAGWLQKNLGRADLRVLDASPARLHRQEHIPGAVSADLMSYGPQEAPPQVVEQRLRAWGIGAGQTIVIVDPGGTYLAAKLFWDLLHHGLPAENLYILDGGMAQWRAQGGALTAEPTPAPPPGSVRVGTRDEAVRVRLPEFLAASGDPRRHVMLEALDPEYFYGGAAFFDRAGHVPHATLMPAADFYNADKTFKSPAEIRRMLAHLGITPQHEVLTYCGGGGAAAVPFFALKYLAGHDRVRLFQESQLGWLQDPRELPVWTYGAPHLVRDTAWLKGWSNPMLKRFGLSAVSVLDLRPAEAFALGHVPLALNLPAAQFEAHLRNPAALAPLLARAGLDPAHEAVLMADGGIDERAALALVLLEALGQRQVSIYLDGIDRWAELGHEVARPAPGEAPKPSAARDGAPGATTTRILTDAQAPPGPYPRVWVATGAQPPTRLPAGVPAARVIHLPRSRLLGADGRPRPAKDIWQALSQAQVPRYAELVLLADTPGEAAQGYVALRLMGLAGLKLWLP